MSEAANIEYMFNPHANEAAGQHLSLGIESCRQEQPGRDAASITDCS